jgi:integrase
VGRGANQENSKMVRGIHNLTESDCAAHIKECKRLGVTKVLCDGGGLYLRATAGGTASWIFRYEVGGRGREHGLGSFNTYTLKAARKKARKCRKQRGKGKDPIAEKQAARAAVRALTTSTAIASKSFKYCLMKYVAFSEPNWDSAKHGRDWEQSLERYAYPIFDKGNQLVSTITEAQVLAVLQPHWIERTETMRRVRGRIEQVLDWAKGKGYRSGENPARWKGNLDAHLNAKVRKPTKHFAALAYHQIPALVADLQTVPDGADALGVATDALLFCLLTAARSRETRLAVWSEVDLVIGVWEIPGTRMKTKKPHRVPLSEATIEVLRRQPTFPQPGMPRTGFIFCNSRGVQALGEGAMLQRLQQLRPGVTTHGTVRSGFSTWCAEVAKAPVEVREACLAHAGDAVVKSYMRSDFLAQRRELMGQWATFCLAPNNITPLRREVV